ncbi:unnamed protein product [Calicophoron daubneyi]|uniref:Gelsolin-like domain-containing protein n=1 Tax=Calicophoron daubneyi TaxID=300641 RepID=A0AAV2T827_CALDB
MCNVSLFNQRIQGNFHDGKPDGQGILSRITIHLTSYCGEWERGSPVYVPHHLRLSPEQVQLDTQFGPQKNFALEAAGDASSVLDECTGAVYKTTENVLRNGFNLTVCVFTEKEKLLVEESGRNLVLWIGRRVSEAEKNEKFCFSSAISTDLLAKQEEMESPYILTPFGFPIRPVSYVKPTYRSEQKGNDESAESVDDAAIKNQECAGDGVPTECHTVFVCAQKTGRGFANWTGLSVDEQILQEREIALRNEDDECKEEVQKQPGGGEEEPVDSEQVPTKVVDIRFILGEFVIVVEDITSSYATTGIHTEEGVAMYLQKDPGRLPPLYVRLKSVEKRSDS